MTRSWETTNTRHGTNSGWSHHQRLNEEPCAACYAARAAYDKRRRGAPDRAREMRLRAKAQSLAEGEMRRRDPELYKRLYEQFKTEVGL